MIASRTHPSAADASGGWTVRCRPKPLAVGTPPVSTAASAGSSTCTTSRSTPDAAPYVGDVGAEPLRQGLGQVATRAVVGQHLVAARLLHGGGEGPRPDDLDLERARVVLGLLLEDVEVLGEQRAGPAQVGPGRVGEPPPGGLHVGAEPLRDREPAAGHVASAPRPGSSGRNGSDGTSPEHQPHRLVEVARVVAGHRADAGRQRHADTPVRAVALIVADPTTRLPS